MPDDDYLPQGVAPAWAPVLRALRRGDDSDVLAELTEKALAATLRNIGGIPDLPEIADEAHRLALIRRDQLAFDGPSPTIGPRRDRRPQIELTWRTARVMLETGAERLTTDRESARLQLAVMTLSRLAWRFGFGRIIPKLVARSTLTAGELQARCDAALEQAGLEKLARALLSHPDGRQLRAPRHPRRSTAALLDTPVRLL